MAIWVLCVKSSNWFSLQKKNTFLGCGIKKKKNAFCSLVTEVQVTTHSWQQHAASDSQQAVRSDPNQGYKYGPDFVFSFFLIS